MTDTIVALSTAPGKSAIAIIRVSGPSAISLAEGIAGPALEPRLATLRTLRTAEGKIIDDAVVMVFQPGKSFTGEAMAEFQTHGSPAVINVLIARLLESPDIRLAEPGEFTLRAFKSGRIDLAEAEALGDLINAETEDQRAQSVRLMSGALHRRAEAWRESLLRSVALVEVTIDWADEEVPENVLPEVAELIGDLVLSLKAELGRAGAAERLRTGFEVALLGAPNCGKSSFLNYLAGREAAITSPEAGTTRDVIELRYDLHGIPVTVLDMAGLRLSDDPIEREGVRRALERSETADIRIRLSANDAQFPEDLVGEVRSDDICIATKSDLGHEPINDMDFHVSSVTGEGMAAVMEDIDLRLRSRVDRAGLLGHARQRAAVQEAISALEAAQNRLEDAPVEIVAEHLRVALAGIGRLTGGTDVESVLGHVFSKFCLGK